MPLPVTTFWRLTSSIASQDAMSTLSQSGMLVVLVSTFVVSVSSVRPHGAVKTSGVAPSPMSTAISPKLIGVAAAIM